MISQERYNIHEHLDKLRIQKLNTIPFICRLRFHSGHILGMFFLKKFIDRFHEKKLKGKKLLMPSLELVREKMEKFKKSETYINRSEWDESSESDEDKSDSGSLSLKRKGTKLKRKKTKRLPGNFQGLKFMRQHTSKSSIKSEDSIESNPLGRSKSPQSLKRKSLLASMQNERRMSGVGESDQSTLLGEEDRKVPKRVGRGSFDFGKIEGGRRGTRLDIEGGLPSISEEDPALEATKEKKNKETPSNNEAILSFSPAMPHISEDEDQESSSSSQSESEDDKKIQDESMIGLIHPIDKRESEDQLKLGNQLGSKEWKREVGSRESNGSRVMDWKENQEKEKEKQIQIIQIEESLPKTLSHRSIAGQSEPSFEGMRKNSLRNKSRPASVKGSHQETQGDHSESKPILFGKQKKEEIKEIRMGPVLTDGEKPLLNSDESPIKLSDEFDPFEERTKEMEPIKIEGNNNKSQTKDIASFTSIPIKNESKFSGQFTDTDGKAVSGLYDEENTPNVRFEKSLEDKNNFDGFPRGVSQNENMKVPFSIPEKSEEQSHQVSLKPSYPKNNPEKLSNIFFRTFQDLEHTDRDSATPSGKGNTIRERNRNLMFFGVKKAPS